MRKTKSVVRKGGKAKPVSGGKTGDSPSQGSSAVKKTVVR